MSDKFFCTRRLEQFPVAEWPQEMAKKVQYKDHWKDRHSMVIEHPLAKPCCSYCGSISGDRLMEILRAGGQVGGTDKSYKWYVHLPMDEDDQARFEENKKGQPENLWWLFNHGKQIAKFYTHHLSPANAREFLDMWGDGNLKHSMYVKPWIPALNSAAPEWFKNQ